MSLPLRLSLDMKVHHDQLGHISTFSNLPITANHLEKKESLVRVQSDNDSVESYI